MEDEEIWFSWIEAMLSKKVCKKCIERNTGVSVWTDKCADVLVEVKLPKKCPYYLEHLVAIQIEPSKLDIEECKCPYAFEHMIGSLQKEKMLSIN